MQFLCFRKIVKIIENLEIWAWLDYCYWHILSLITNFDDAIMQQLPNLSTKLLNSMFKNLWIVSYAQLQ